MRESTLQDQHPLADALVQRETTNRAMVRWWLYLICLLIFVMVIVGGATRLTDSGLSITEWKPIHGVIPPLSASDWNEEFEKYKQIPEYQQINKGMSLDAFKFIYWWEWGHRFLGRIIGLVYFLPMVFFWATGRLEPGLKPRLTALLILGGAQGAIGWWMVTSGLADRVDVSQYRLAIHLTLACLILAYALWIARGLASHSDEDCPPWMPALAAIVTGLLTLQIFLGGLVAGLDAGLAFNDWPLMDGALVPGGLQVLEPVWLNWFENPKSVQFNHRMLAYAILALLCIQLICSARARAGATHKRRVAILLGLGLIQAGIGVVTLVLQVPLYWALAHQGGAVIVLAFSVAHLRAFRGSYPPLTAIRFRA